MNDFGTVGSIAGNPSLSKLKSKIHVSMDTTQNVKPFSSVEGPVELKQLAIEMKQADDAFALMMEIRGNIEKAYKELSPPEA